MKKIILTVFVISIGTTLFSQSGFLKGKVIDETTGEPLFGSTVVKNGTTLGAVADFDGNYSLSLFPGRHIISFQSVGFKTILVEDVVIEEGKTTILDMILVEDVQQLGEVVVTAEVIQDNDIGMLLVQKKSLNTVDGISSNTFGKIGDRNLSSAIKRVTGVSVQEGKYVYVRGLGDRYTKTAINGMVIPGLDPDRNNVQIDIFPTGILENVVVYKTFTPDLTGDFTGGMLDIQTKAFPDQRLTSISLNLSFNPDMHFRSDFLQYNGSATDFLGFDNGKRELPVEPGVTIPSDNETTSLFDPVLGAERTNSFMNTGFSFTHRNRLVGNKITWGYNALLTFNTTHNYFEDFERRRYERDITENKVVLLRDFTAKGSLASSGVLWSSLISLAARAKNHTIGTKFLRIQNGVSTSLDRTRSNSSLNNPTFIHNDILTYTERAMLHNLFYGKHQFDKLRVSWTNSLILSKQDEPDYRETAFNEDDGQLGFGNGAVINRFWRELSEVNESFRLDFEYELNDRNKVKTGGIFTLKDRDFDVFQYAYSNLLSGNVNSLNPNELLQDDNIISKTNPHGLVIGNQSNSGNSYKGRQNIFAGYLMNEMRLTDQLQSIYGVRLEHAKMLYTGVIEQLDGTEELLTNQETLNEINLLPSLSLIYSVNDDMNVRASFNKTLARPSFKEKSASFIADPISSIFFLGNINIEQAEIINYDLRWEYFFTPSELFSVSLFHKDFSNHIAIVAFSNSPNQVKPRNVGQAVVYGSELEFRKRLAFLGGKFEDILFGSNFSYVFSKVDRQTVAVNESGISEYQSEADYRKTEVGVDRYRNLSSQTPFSLNTFISYESDKNGITANISYNVQGETLTYVSASNIPEVYTRPFHSLNLKVSKTLGKEGNSSLGITFKNILDDDNELFYRLNDVEKPFSFQSPGRLISASYTYNF